MEDGKKRKLAGRKFNNVLEWHVYPCDEFQ